MVMIIFFMDQNQKNKSLSEILDIKKLMNVDRAIERANGLPNECYTSKQYLEYERDKIFCNKWSVIGVGSSIREDKEKDVFVHMSAVKDSGVGYLDEGDSLTFEIEEGKKGPSAVNLKKE